MIVRLPIKRVRLWARLAAIAVVIALALPGGEFASADADRATRIARPTIVLVHGYWADGSSWNAVTERLIDRGYNTASSATMPHRRQRIPQELPRHDSRCRCCSTHSRLRRHHSATCSTNVKALVYIDAFIPVNHEGEQVRLHPQPDLGRR